MEGLHFRSGRRVRWWARRPAAIAVAFGVALIIAVNYSKGDSRPARHVVEITGFEFRPAVLKVTAGDTVVWVNRDVVPHTATSQAGKWDSGALEQRASWSLVPRSRGETSYVCTFHPVMTGKLIVH